MNSKIWQHQAKEWGHRTPHQTDVSSGCTCNACCYDMGLAYIPVGGKCYRGCQNCVKWVDGSYRCTLGCWVNW